MAQELVAYVNGDIVPESEAKISIFDLGFLHGEAAFDTARTFAGRVFKLEEHVDRLLRSCRYLQLDPGLGRDALVALTHEVLERNLPALAPGEDFWVSQRVGRGVSRRGFDGGTTLLVECTYLPFAQRAPLYRDGIHLITPSIRRTPPWAQSPRAKTHNYLNVELAEKEVHAIDPRAFSCMLDENGHLCEGWGCNVFLVRDGELLTPRERHVLPGISRQVVLELAARLGIPAREHDLDPYDLHVADEAFLTSTSLCIGPVSRYAHRPVGDGRVPGPVTRALLDAYDELVGLDIVGQYLAHLAPAEGNGAGVSVAGTPTETGALA